jgi:NADPH:quinone reductase-like Zn-dependent oxidoreductase
VKPGDAVVVNPGVSCGTCAFCQEGEESLCVSYRLLGEHLPGSFAEAVRVPERNLEKLAGNVAWPAAAAFPLSHLTAWRMLATRAAVQPGELVLVWGIGGGVALAALDVALYLGATVIVTSGSDAKLQRARALGAAHGINHRTQDVAREVRRLSGKRGADVVVDSVGAATWEHSLRALARGGRLVCCGATSGPMVTTDVRKLFWHHWSILGSTMGNAREFATVTRLFTEGELRPVVDTVLPMADARAGFERMQRGEQFGKIVLSGFGEA